MREERNDAKQISVVVGTTRAKVGQDIDGQAAGDRFGTSVAVTADGAQVVIGARQLGAGCVRARELPFQAPVVVNALLLQQTIELSKERLI